MNVVAITRLCSVLLLALASSALTAAPLTLTGYQHPDGAISIFENSNDVDPYFAGKALLVAHDAGLDIQAIALPWINWGLQHQRADGGFDRFCRRDERWQACAPADADDSAAAVWIELLAKLAPGAGFPSAWLASIDRAQKLLKTLYNPTSHIYFISAQQPVGLLMDNVEVYSALLAASRLKQATGDPAQSLEFARQADVLANSIVRVFWQPCLQRLRVSTQKDIRPGFYPDQVAELFPILAELNIPDRDQGAFIQRWFNENQSQWLSQASIDFPWGLVAIAADKLGQQANIDCWLTLAANLRHGEHWNVLEEAVFESLHGKANRPSTTPSTCRAIPSDQLSSSLSAPENLSARRTAAETIELHWGSRRSGNQPAGYEILRNNQYLGISRTEAYTDKQALPGTPYRYSVRAYDAFGRFSPPAMAAAAAADSDRFVTIYLESERPQTKVRFQIGDSPNTAEAGMDQACSRYLTKTINLGSGQNITVSFSDPQGVFDDNRGNKYRLAPGIFTLSHGTVVDGDDPCQDDSAPSTPEALSQISASAKSVELAWNAAKDNTTVSRYVVIRNGAEVAETAQTRFSDTCVAPLTTYSYQVRAIDSAENASSVSNALIVTTLPK